MSDQDLEPGRLVDEGGLGADLLRSAKADAPGASSREQTAIRLGLAAAGTGELVKAGGGAALLAKLGVVVLAAAVGVGVIASRGATKEAPKPSVTVQAPVVAPSELAAPQEETSVVLPPRASVSAPVRAPVVAPSKAGEEEVALIAEARNAVARGDQVSANAALDRYAREYPRGALTMDAGVLRVEALVRWGETEKAQRLAKELLGKEPAPAQAGRLRELLKALAP